MTFLKFLLLRGRAGTETQMQGSPPWPAQRPQVSTPASRPSDMED